jgi:hypothetical protein
MMSPAALVIYSVLFCWLPLYGQTLLAAAEATQDRSPNAVNLNESAVIYFYRQSALTNHPASVFIDDDEVCSVHPEMFCVVEVRPGKHGVAQFSTAYSQVQIAIEPGLEYYSTFKPINILPLENNPGWRLVPSERGQKEILGLKREEIAVPAGVFPRDEFAHFETIQVRFGDRVETTFVYSYTNRSASDYVLKDGLSATLVEENQGDWMKSPDFRLNYPLIAPAGKRVLLMLSVSYEYSAPLKKGEQPNPQEIASFLKEKDTTRDHHRFFVFDTSNRMKVHFVVRWEPKAEIVGNFPE